MSGRTTSPGGARKGVCEMLGRLDRGGRHRATAGAGLAARNAAPPPHVPLQKTIGQARPEVVPSLIVMNADGAALDGPYADPEEDRRYLDRLRRPAGEGGRARADQAECWPHRTRTMRTQTPSISLSIALTSVVPQRPMLKTRISWRGSGMVAASGVQCVEGHLQGAPGEAELGSVHEGGLGEVDAGSDVEEERAAARPVEAVEAPARLLDRAADLGGFTGAEPEVVGRGRHQLVVDQACLDRVQRALHRCPPALACGRVSHSATRANRRVRRELARAGARRQWASTASISSATMLVILIIGFTAGPAVSL